jgi:NAD(P)-dependent dehydrogenase (short-subunit alcohol dehydrogenase family)
VDLGLAGATAVVQGGTQGMGLAAAECFAADGARVGVLARTRASLDKTVDHLLELGAADAVALPADITRPDEVTAHSTNRQTESLISYTAAKAMVTSITKNLSLSLARDEILVNTVSPGSFASEGVAVWAWSVGIDPDDLHAVMRGITEHFGHPAHLPRAGAPAEIGAVIALAASRRNTYMTGANINVDGGSDFC